MRVHVVSAVVAFALMACGTPNMEMDVQQPIDVTFDIQQVDMPTAPTDTGPVTCDFEPGEVNPTCRILSQVCTTGPLACDGGTSIPMVRCSCQMVRMFGQVWRCDNYCGYDAGTAVDDAATE